MSQSGTELPNFVLVGAAKAGTTSLYHYLRQHPEVYLPDSYKESRFFASELLKDVLHYKQTSIFTFEDFKALYRGAEGYGAIGDFGNTYLLYPDHVIPKIKQYLGDVKIVMVLRDPVERAFSAYQFACRNQYEAKNFEYGIKHEAGRVPKYGFPPDIYHYKESSLYYEKVKKYLAAFSNVRVILFEDLRDKPQTTLEDLFGFLGVQKDVAINHEVVYNQGGWIPANAGLLNALFNNKTLANKVKPYLARMPFAYRLVENAVLALKN
jgi:Sulfotransferase domain.